MRLIGTLCLIGSVTVPQAQDLAVRTREMEVQGQSGAARAVLLAAVRDAPSDPVTWTIAAEFLDRHGDPAARPTYERLLALLEQSGSAERSRVARRLAVLDLLAGDQEAAQKHLDRHRAANAGY